MRRTSEAGRILPKARQEGLVVEELDDEVLIYDRDNDEAHCLNETAALIWKHCDGKSSVSSLAGLLPQGGDGRGSEELVWRAVDQLNRKQLLAEPVLRPVDGRDWSRREMLVRIGGAGAAAAVAAPLVKSIVAPTPAAAATPCPAKECTSCTTNAQCGAGCQCCQVTTRPSFHKCVGVTESCNNPNLCA